LPERRVAAVAFEAAIGEIDALAGGGVARGCVAFCSERRAGHERQQRMREQRSHVAHRDSTMVSSSAGSPGFTTAMARCSAGARSWGMARGDVGAPALVDDRALQETLRRSPGWRHVVHHSEFAFGVRHGARPALLITSTARPLILLPRPPSTGVASQNSATK
jgi:hypothetical protein